MILHDIDAAWLKGIELPQKMNNPLDYEPHPLCIKACQQLQSYLSQREDWREEIDHGKMFGVLIVEKPQQKGDEALASASPVLGYLAAYSGQIGGRSDWPDFVPAVFDYLQPDGYFKTTETTISRMTKSIKRIEEIGDMANAKQQIDQLQANRQQKIADFQVQMKQAKAQRDARRQEGNLSKEEEADMIKQSQYMKAELRRLRKSLEKKTPLEEEYEANLRSIKQLKLLRQMTSDNLQEWLFSKFHMLNAKGESKGLLEIFKNTTNKIPPSGSGECCEPKLLQYAYSHGYRPIQMAMFWWGESPKEEIRHHLHFYPACNGKCKPILQWMLPDVCEFHTEKVVSDGIETLFEDDEIVVISKPAGMLSVPGKGNQPSVYSIMRQRYPEATGPLIVHRLDMDTSGIMVIAKTEFAYHRLQEQFVNHLIDKQYMAIVCCRDQKACATMPRKGTISLPLMPDLVDRPRQIVSYEYGKDSITEYEVLEQVDDTHLRLALYPHTGRTHQLRVHCAHREGLDAPILGDPLYGNEPASRLYLHACFISFDHPITGEMITIEKKADF